MSRRLCCCRDCLICGPTIAGPARALTASGDIFHERVGDWEIQESSTSEWCVATSGTSDAVATCQTPHPADTPTCWAWTTIEDAQNGRKYRLIVNYDPTAGTYLYAEIETTSTTAFTFRLCSSGGGVLQEETGFGYSVGDQIEMSVCRTLTGFYGSCTEMLGTTYTCVSGYEGRYAGVGSGNTSEVEFSAFLFYEHRYTLPQKNCGTCSCECGGQPPDQVGWCLPKVFKWTITAAGDCVCANGTEGVVEWEGWSTDPWQWSQTSPVTVAGCGVTYDWKLSCTSDVDGNTWFQLCDHGVACDGLIFDCGSGIWGLDADGVVCDPIAIAFHLGVSSLCHPYSAEDPKCDMWIVFEEA